MMYLLKMQQVNVWENLSVVVVRLLNEAIIIVIV